MPLLRGHKTSRKYEQRQTAVNRIRISRRSGTRAWTTKTYSNVESWWFRIRRPDPDFLLLTIRMGGKQEIVLIFLSS